MTIILSGLLTVGVKALGFAREVLLTFYFGVSEVVDAYVLVLLAAWLVAGPVSGSFSTLITPRYIQFDEKNRLSDAASLFQKTLLVIVLFVIVIEAVQLLLLAWLPVDWTSRFTILSELYWTILVPVALFSSISIAVGGVLMGQGRVKTYVCLPATVSVTVIASLLLFSPFDPLMALVYGTFAGFALEALTNLIAVRNLLTFSRHKLRSVSDDFGGMLAKIPMLVGSAFVMSACVIVDQVMAVLAGPGSVSAISFGSRLSVGLISVTAVIWTVLYPVFSRLVAQRDFGQLRQRLIQNIIVIMLLGVPSCGVLAYFSPELTRLLFERGAFDSNATASVSQIQVFYVLHIPLYVVLMVCMRIANALQSNRSLLVGNLLALTLNVFFNLLFIEWFGAVGIAMATLIAYCVMVIYWLVIANRLITTYQQA